MPTSPDLTISLEPHLTQTLIPLRDRLPDDLGNLLSQELDKTEIHYALLSRISRWARSEPGKKALKKAHLDPGDYHMVSLLAGTKTAPLSKFPPYSPPEPDEVKVQKERNDRRALAFVINGFLSVICSGAAAWWAADKSGWQPEWKVLIGLLVSSVIGLSETVLFIIWQSRLSSRPKPRMSRAPVRDKKDEDAGESTLVPPDNGQVNGDSSLRRRIAPKNES